MVASAMTRGWLGVVVSVTALGMLGDIGAVQAQSRRAHNQLSTGIECYRRGDYELADTFFQQALAGQEDLTPAERQELNGRVQLNNTALQGRRSGEEQLRNADDAIRAGRVQQATELMKEVLGNQFLRDADKQKARQLGEQLRPRVGGPSQPVTPAGVTPLITARAKLEQARKLMAKGDYAAAEALVNEADGLGASYTMGEDTPSKVRTDLVKMRGSRTVAGAPEAKDAKALLAAGRAALDKGNIAEAEKLAMEAEKADSVWSMHLWGDSPSKLMKDVQAARAKMASAPKPASPAPGAKPTTVAANPSAPKPASPAPGTKPVETPAVATGPNAVKPGDPTATAAKPKESSGFSMWPFGSKPKEEPAKPTTPAVATGPTAPKPGTTPPQGTSVAGGPIGTKPSTTPPAPVWPTTPAVATGPTTPKPGATGSTPAGTKPPEGTTVASGPIGAKPSTTPPASRPTTPPTTVAAVPLPKAPATGDTEGARELLRQGRKALQDSNMAKAKELADQAARKKPNLEFWEDNPEKLLADVRRIEAKGSAPTGTVVQAGTKPEEKPVETTSSDPRAMLRQARGLYAEGKLDDARVVAQKANASASAKWGLFEDTPEKLLVDIQKERVKRDKEESVKVLAEARTLYEQGRLEDAETKAYRASRLHGTYSVWDLGDRPEKLLAEIQTAKVRGRKLNLPTPPVAVAQNDPKPKPTGTTGPSVASAPPAPMWPTEQTPPTTVAKPPVTPPTTVVQTPPTTVDQTPPTTVVETGPSTVVQAPPTFVTPPAGGPTFAPPTPIAVATNNDAAKPQARAMMVEVRSLQKDGKLVEARQKALECQKLGVTFDPDEDRPETALLQLAALADKRIDSLMQEATDYAATGQADPSRFQKAESDLMQAKQLAQGFGLDTQGIDNKNAWVKQLMAKGPAPVGVGMPVPAQPVASAARQRGLELLSKSRLELRSGQMTTARRLAEEAYSGPYEVQQESAAMLRSIDAEEFNQHQLEAEKTFDSGKAAFLRKEFAQAGAIFRNLDPRLLSKEKQSKLKDLMMSPEMQLASASRPAAAVPPLGERPGATGDVQLVKGSTPAPAGADSYPQQVQAMQEIEFQRLREEGLRVQREATSAFQTGSAEQAIEMLQDYRDRLGNGGLDQDRITLLRKPIEARVQQFKTLKAQKTFEALSKGQTDAFKQKKQQEVLAEEQKQKELKALVTQYNSFRKEGKYRDALLAAAKARELDPDNPITDAMYITAKTLQNQDTANRNKQSREDLNISGLGGAEDFGPDVKDKHEVDFPKDFQERTKDRAKWKSLNIGGPRTEKEREIDRRLNAPINLEFKETPLYRAVEDLRDLTGINVIIDRAALEEAGINLDRPLTEKLESVSLKSALNILLRQLHLTYVIKDEVLQITTEKHARGKLAQRTFPVADIIIPVDNHVLPNSANLMHMLGKNGADSSTLQLGGSMHAPKGGLPGGADVSSMLNQVNGSSTTGTTPNTPIADTRQPGQLQTMEQLLIKLITNTIAPQSWSEVGGQGTIEYYPLGMALVINQVPDVQEQVADLLDALRRLQDLEVSVEVRMITLSEAFFERIGVDFNMNIKTDKITRTFEPQLVTQQFKPALQVNDPNPSRVIAGYQPAGSGFSFGPGAPGVLTSDLDIPIHSSSFQYAIPPFGGYPGIPGADGGLSMGLAFLSDIQVFLFMEAAQGDRRFNVMQAPKLTLFNGQTSTIQIQDFQFFVTNVQVVQSGGQVVFVPQNQPLPLGVNLAVQAVVSGDRRFVRLNLAPTLTNLASATVPLFPITTFITPVFDGGAQGQPIPFTQFIQQPTFTTVTVQTSVSVPDGGTVLLGGLKLLNEGRNEFGPPVLSKIPYISRLFRNVGYGRDTSSLLLMVTPRIIINSEEEFLQTGVGGLATDQTGRGQP